MKNTPFFRSYRLLIIFLFALLVSAGVVISVAYSQNNRPPADYPVNQDYGQQGDFIAKRAVNAGRSAIINTIGPVLMLLPESPGSSEAHITLQNWDSSWDMSNPLNPQFMRYVNCHEGICRNGQAQHAHATHTNFWNGEAYLWTNNYWEIGNSHRYDAGSGDTVSESPFWQETAGRLYSPFWTSDLWSYGAPFSGNQTLYYTHESQPGDDWRGRPFAIWDHLGTTGVTGFFSFHGDLMVVASDQANTGMAIYSMNGWREGLDNSDFDPPLLAVYQPTLREPDGSSVGLGGYWAEPYGATKMVWAARRNDEAGRAYPAMYVVDFADPRNPALTCELYFNQDPIDPADGDNMTMPMYVNYQDQYAFVDDMKVDIHGCEAAYQAGKATNPNYIIDTSEMSSFVFKFDTHQNHCDGSQYFRPLGQIGVFGGYDRFGTEAIITYDGPTIAEGSWTAFGYFAHNLGPNRAVVGNADVQVGDQNWGGNHTVTSVEIDERVNTQGMCFFVISDEADTTAPFVSGHRPLANETNVAVDTFISIHIPETLRTETAVNAFQITRDDNGATVPFQHRLSHTGTFTLWPDDQLVEDVTYHVDIAGIQDYMGNTMTPYRFSFTTGDDPIVVPPPVENGWVDCAQNGQTCTVPSTTVVRYGTAGAYFYQEAVSGSIGCNAAVFGGGGGAANRCWYWAGPDVPSFDGTPFYPNQSSQLSCLPESETNNLWVVNPDNHSVAIIDTFLEPGSNYPMLNEQRELFSGFKKPTSVTRIGSHVAVTFQADDKVVFFDGETAVPAFTIDTGHGSEPIASVTDGSSLFVALFGSGEIIEIDPASQLIVNRVAVGPTPRAMALHGSRLLVTRYISSATSGAVYDLDIGNGLSLTRTIDVNKVLVNDDLDHGSGIPNFLSSIVINADGSAAFVTAIKANIDRGTSSVRSGTALDDDNTVRPMMVQLDLINNQDANLNPNTPEGTFDFDNAADPAAVTFLANGESQMIALQGNNLILALEEGGFAQFGAGFAPQSMCTTLRTLYVKNFTDRTVMAIDVAGYMENGDRNPETLAISTVGEELLSSAEVEGLQQFYFSGIPQMGPEGYMSCASCHGDGGQDGQVWDLTSLGEGLRNTISLNGSSGTRFGNLHWSANFDEVQDFELQIEHLNGGDGLIPGETFTGQSPLAVQTAGQTAELDALAAYVASLGRDSVSRSPHRTYTGALTEAAQRGQLVFETSGCASCHAGSAFRDGNVHDVGTIRDTSGSRLGESLSGIRTPSLIELWESAPYFHDGSAATLVEVFDVGTHQLSLSEGDEADLIEFLLSIDQTMFIDDNVTFPEGTGFVSMLPSVFRNAAGAPAPLTPPNVAPASTPAIVDLQQVGSHLSLTWRGCDDAVLYRVLVGVDGQRPSVLETSTRAIVTPELTENGRYQLIVECVDAVGNGAFSNPAIVDFTN